MRRLPYALLAFALAFALVAMPSTAAAKPKNKKDKKGAAAEVKKEGKFKDWKSVTKESEKLTGFFTMYRKDGALHLEIPADRLDTPFLGV